MHSDESSVPINIRGKGGTPLMAATSTPHHSHIRTIDSRSSSVSSLGVSETFHDLITRNAKLTHRTDTDAGLEQSDSESDSSVESDTGYKRFFGLGFEPLLHQTTPIESPAPSSKQNSPALFCMEIGDPNRTPNTPSVSRFSDADESSSPYHSLQLTPSHAGKPPSATLAYPPKSPSIIFKKLMTRNSAMTHLKSLKRITRELQNEISPLDTEIRHEAVVTFSFKDDDEALERDDNLKRYEIVNRANEAWNHRRSSVGEAPPSPAAGITGRLQEVIHGVKRKQAEDETLSSKRRAVSPLITSRRNSKLIQNANEDFEMLSLQ
ncbi:unnamed protein product [Kuraishia capsulata CBS 1993]|uniref:Uncharacterized protein n=1 Tax=Kuraishia capsulata CBS 1993 TaxID=1382522 RepID=W6MU60_9ASCO|nr:uncharacterized protein KUCA_T00004877001 [Kuraishia capsulata CBS 1993]CDK28892.1 unnamed protein product [Kuraishia capsulata CBS 1993]